ncbi:MAG: MFS transporter [Caldilineales bacterium]|nr:MFS transporter [Caldilineales bacterium]
MLKPIPTYFLIQAVFGLLFTSMATVSAIYRVQVVYLDPLQLVLVGTALEGAYFLAEIPTGVIADTYSRKLSLIIGFILIGIGFAVEGLFPTFATVLLAQVIWGVGATFLSGAEEAWIAGEIGEENLTSVMIRGDQISRVMSILGVLLAMLIGAIALGLTFVLAGAGIILMGLALIVLMPETNFQPAAADERNTWKKMGITVRDGAAFVRASNVLMLIFAIELCFGLSSEGIDRLSEAHLLENFTWPTFPAWQPIIWLGSIRIANSLINIGVSEWLRRHVARSAADRTIRIMQLLSTIWIVALIAFAFASSFMLGVMTWMLAVQMRWGVMNLYTPWVTKQIDQRVRATVLSMWGQMHAFGEIIGGPLIGAIATITTLATGYASIALLLLPVPILFGIVRRKQALPQPSTPLLTSE